MNAYTSETVEFFTLVLTSGMIAVAALAIASMIGFTVAFVLFRERAVVAVRAAEPTFELGTRSTCQAAPASIAETLAAVAG